MTSPDFLNLTSSPYLETVYLDVWNRHITSTTALSLSFIGFLSLSRLACRSFVRLFLHAVCLGRSAVPSGATGGRRTDSAPGAPWSVEDGRGNQRPSESGFWIGVQKQNQQSVAAAFLHPTAAQSGNWQVSLSVKIALMHLTDVREGAI